MSQVEEIKKLLERTGKKEEIKKLPDSAIGMLVYDEVDDSFYKITVNEDGEKQKEFVSQS